MQEQENPLDQQHMMNRDADAEPSAWVLECYTPPSSREVACERTENRPPFCDDANPAEPVPISGLFFLLMTGLLIVFWHADRLLADSYPINADN